MLRNCCRPRFSVYCLLPSPTRTGTRTARIVEQRSGGGRIVCFRDDDLERGFEIEKLKDLRKIELSPWGRAGLCLKKSGGDSSNRGGNGNNGSKGRGGPGDSSGKKRKDSSSIGVTLLLTFSALHLGYCIAAWMRKDSNQLGIEFYGLGLGLVCLLATSAVFLSLGVVSDAYFLGLWGCLAALIGTGETWFVQKHGRWSGFVILFGIATVTMSAACEENLGGFSN